MSALRGREIVFAHDKSPISRDGRNVGHVSERLLECGPDCDVADGRRLDDPETGSPRDARPVPCVHGSAHEPVGSLPVRLQRPRDVRRAVAHEHVPAVDTLGDAGRGALRGIRVPNGGRFAVRGHFDGRSPASGGVRGRQAEDGHHQHSQDGSRHLGKYEAREPQREGRSHRAPQASAAYSPASAGGDGRPGGRSDRGGYRCGCRSCSRRTVARRRRRRPVRHARPARRARSLVVVPPGPIPGYLLIADRGNNRIILVDSRKRIIWRYPAAGSPPAAPFRYDDDAFFAPGYGRIISNQEDQDTVQVLSFPAGKLLWSYGHANVRSGAAGFLNTPDDAYLLPNGLRSVADAYNCRVIFLSAGHRIVRTIGTTGVCRHDPPRTLGAVNGATPLPNGDTLISEIAGAWIDDVTRAGLVRWSFQAPVSYPSDPQPLAGGHILLADYARPGHVVILDHRGDVLWRYGPASGPGALDHPSLALPLGHGLIAVNDDYRDRVVLISIRTHRIVWQYGHTDKQGTASGLPRHTGRHGSPPDGGRPASRRSSSRSSAPPRRPRLAAQRRGAPTRVHRASGSSGSGPARGRRVCRRADRHRRRPRHDPDVDERRLLARPCDGAAGFARHRATGVSRCGRRRDRWSPVRVRRRRRLIEQRRAGLRPANASRAGRRPVAARAVGPHSGSQSEPGSTWSEATTACPLNPRST